MEGLGSPVESLEIDSGLIKPLQMDSTTALNTQITEKWFKPCIEKIEEIPPKAWEAEKNAKGALLEKSASEHPTPNEPTTKIVTLNTCKSSSGVCTSTALKGFEFCHKHILEDKTSPYKRCNFVSKEGNQRCTNSAPKMGDKRSFCIHHDNQIEVGKSKPKKKKVKKPAQETKEKKIPNNANNNNKRRLESSSSEEEYNFFTDSVQVDKTACTWLGNQGSDADSTDSEDENPLNHAGTWTVEECIRICKEKMSRLRFLYMQQYKRLGYTLKEERRKLLNEYDMDPYVLSKVGHYKKSDDTYADFVEDIHLTNYQRNSGEEQVAEKMMREKRNHGHHGRRSDLPRCQHSTDGVRCALRVLPFSKFCFTHICLDQEQYLFESCKDVEKNNKKCSQPSEIFHENCLLHISLAPSSTEKAMHIFEIAKKSREARKRRKQEQTKTEKSKEVEKKDVIYHNTRRASLKNKEDGGGLRSPTTNEPKTPKVVCLAVEQEQPMVLQPPDRSTGQEQGNPQTINEPDPSEKKLETGKVSKMKNEVKEEEDKERPPTISEYDPSEKGLEAERTPERIELHPSQNEQQKDTAPNIQDQLSETEQLKENPTKTEHQPSEMSTSPIEEEKPVPVKGLIVNTPVTISSAQVLSTTSINPVSLAADVTASTLTETKADADAVFIKPSENSSDDSIVVETETMEIDPIEEVRSESDTAIVSLESQTTHNEDIPEEPIQFTMSS